MEHAATTTSTQCTSRRYTPVVSTVDVLDVKSFDTTNPRAVIETGPPALVVSGLLTAKNTLPAVEVGCAAESCQGGAHRVNPR
jgi:hypothetical protein